MQYILLFHTSSHIQSSIIIEWNIWALLQKFEKTPIV